MYHLHLKWVKPEGRVLLPHTHRRKKAPTRPQSDFWDCHTALTRVQSFTTVIIRADFIGGKGGPRSTSAFTENVPRTAPTAPPDPRRAGWVSDVGNEDERRSSTFFLKEKWFEIPFFKKGGRTKRRRQGR